jgi:hypothetical protein
VPTESADAFRAHLEKTAVRDYERSGAFDVRILRRVDGRFTHFLVQSSWEKMSAITAFAGPDPDIAVLYPDDDVYGLVPDRHVVHYLLDES